jgi:hypothetical protein
VVARWPEAGRTLGITAHDLESIIEAFDHGKGRAAFCGSSASRDLIRLPSEIGAC